MFVSRSREGYQRRTRECVTTGKDHKKLNTDPKKNERGEKRPSAKKKKKPELVEGWGGRWCCREERDRWGPPTREKRQWVNSSDSSRDSLLGGNTVTLKGQKSEWRKWG